MEKSNNSTPVNGVAVAIENRNNQKETEMPENLNIVPRVVGQQSVKWTQGSGMSRTLDNQSRSIAVQPQSQLSVRVGNNSTSNISAQRATIANTDPHETSYQRIRQYVHNMRTYSSWNVPIAIRPSTSNVLQTRTVTKTNGRLPVISGAVDSSSHSVSALPYHNTSNITTLSASSGHPASVPLAGDNSLYVPSAIIHHLPSSVSNVSEISFLECTSLFSV